MDWKEHDGWAKAGKIGKHTGIGLLGVIGISQILDIKHNQQQKLESIRMINEAEREMERRKKHEDKMTRDLLVGDAYNILPGLPGNDIGKIVLDMWNNRIGHTRF